LNSGPSTHVWLELKHLQNHVDEREEILFLFFIVLSLIAANSVQETFTPLERRMEVY